MMIFEFVFVLIFSLLVQRNAATYVVLYSVSSLSVASGLGSRIWRMAVVFVTGLFPAFLPLFQREDTGHWDQLLNKLCPRLDRYVFLLL
jgi:hypothetical protein